MTPDPGTLEERLTLAELEDAWSLLAAEDRADALRELPPAQAQDYFFGLRSQEQAQVVLAFPVEERRTWMRILPPDGP